MAQVVVRNLEDEVKEALRRRAARHGRSMEEELRVILRRAAFASDDGERVGLGTRLAARFAGIGLDEDIPELRGEPVRPAEFDHR
jgi:plasmid stability protein